MTPSNPFFRYLLYAVLAITLIGFIPHLIDSMDIELMDIKEILPLNRMVGSLLLPIAILLTWITIHITGNHLKAHRKENIYSKSLKYYHPVTWWIPLFHFVGSFKSFKVIENDAEQILDKTGMKKLKSGMRWINVGIFLFLSLIFIGLACDYVNNNGDSQDFLWNTYYMHTIVILIGSIKICSSVFGKRNETEKIGKD